MAKKRGRVRLVIDASVLRAAGESEAPSSRECRLFLESVLRICHRAVASRALTAEWRRNRSRIGRLWLVQMFARKKVEIFESEASVTVDAEGLDLTARQRRALLKDLHLVKTALQADWRVVSLDDGARTIFAHAAGSITALQRLVWVNPVAPEERAIEWLEAMCPQEAARTLGRSRGA